ncbi:MAG: thiamine phosphate synthase [Candidatus Rokubacteria bacterium]|nr:thiamine phosphate synthase [Candidatus Rokubacteria bacterium]
MPAVGFRLCLVTDRRATGGRPLPDVVEACLGAGLPAVQLREKDLGARELLALARELRARTARHDARLLVNDRADVAVAAAADGVHLPAAGLPPDVARRLVGPDRLVGVSTHSPVEAAAAERDGADFVLFGPVYDTPSKRPYGAPQGLAALGEVCRRLTIPVFAVGGVTAARVGEVRAAGAAGVAVIRALLEAEDPAAATKALLAACEAAWP